MENLITICNEEISIKEYNGQRVVTLWDIARLHGRETEEVRKTFERNKKYLIDKEDYFILEKQSEFARTLSRSKEVSIQALNASKNIPVFTESGYLMMTKPMQDELSWQVQKATCKRVF